jgi:hypothetical protein
MAPFPKNYDQAVRVGLAFGLEVGELTMVGMQEEGRDRCADNSF